MANIKIPQLSPLVNQVLTDVYEMSPAVPTPGSSRKETRQQMIDFIQSYTSVNAISIYADSNSGIDAPGRGSAIAPYLTISYAAQQAAIGGASAIKPYEIIAQGDFSDDTFIIRPWISFDFQSSTYTVAFSAESFQWNNGGYCRIKGGRNLSFPIFTIDFRPTTSGICLFEVDDVNTQDSAEWQFFGALNAPSFVSVSNLKNIFQMTRLKFFDCFGIVEGFVGESISFFKNEAVVDGPFTAYNCDVLNGILVNKLTLASATSPSFYSCKIAGNSRINSEGNFTAISANFYGCQIEALEISGAQSFVRADVLKTNLTFSNSAVASQVSIDARYMISAGLGLTYDPVTGEMISTIPTASFGMMSFTGNTDPTPVAGIGIPAKIDGTYIPSNLQDFTFVFNALRYTGAASKAFYISFNGSASLNMANDKIKIYIFVNGALVSSNNLQYSLDGTTPSFKAICTQYVGVLNFFDIVGIYVSNETSLNAVTFDSASCAIMSIGGGQ